MAHRHIQTSFLQHIPGAAQNHRHMLPLYPAAARSLDLRGYDLIVTSDSGPVKGARVSPGATLVCYCHSPMRYLYDKFAEYSAHMGPLTRLLFTATAGRVRRFDLSAAASVTYFIANSRYIADRILRTYKRPAEVIYPPVEVTLARFGTPGDHYLAAGRLVAYKRTDLMIEACLRLGRRLRIVGAGPDFARLQAIAAAHPEAHLIEFLGELPVEELWQNYANCRALLFAADEDFGIVPLEAQACGRPVIAYGVGGSLETVRGTGKQPTGVYFAEQTVESLITGISDFESRESSFDPIAANAFAATFATAVFLERIRSFILARVPAAEPYAATVEQALATVHSGRL